MIQCGSNVFAFSSGVLSIKDTSAQVSSLFSNKQYSLQKSLYSFVRLWSLLNAGAL